MAFTLNIHRKSTLPGLDTTATTDNIPTRSLLTRALADNIRNDRGTSHITITVRKNQATVYTGSVEGLRGKRLGPREGTK